MKIAIIGTGYIGLVSGVCLARSGHDVICADNNVQKIEALQSGIVTIYEPGLQEMMKQVISDGKLHFTTDTIAATRNSSCIMIGVGTPTAADGYSSDLSFLFGAGRDIAKGLDEYRLVIVKSTVPTGTTRKLGQIIREANPAADFEVASNPEFLREGAAVFDFMNPDRIVIGTESPPARALLQEMYAPFLERGHTMLETGIESAELIKYASNGFLATKIAFINEMAELCERVGANALDVAKGMGLDDRIGPKFLNPGPGFGGSCFPKDTRGLKALGDACDVPMRITEAVIASNNHAKLRMVKKIAELAGGDLTGKQIAVLGVTFKPDTDDMREAPSLVIIPALQARGANIRVVDPQGTRHGTALLPGVTWHEDAYAAADGADMVVVLTEWRQFRTLDLGRLARCLRTPLMADLRNIYELDALKAAGFVRTCSVGR